MEPLQLQDVETGSSARIATEQGFNCFEFRAVVDGQPIDVLDASPNFAAGGERPSGHGIPILFPYPNRIRGGRYAWDGKEYELSPDVVPFDPTGNAIHGLCLDRPWKVVSQGDHFAVGRFRLSEQAPDRRSSWPADFTIEVRYELRGSVLRADIGIVNNDDVPLPWGFGTHPYFRLPLLSKSAPKDCLIEVPASQQWELENCLPTGNRLPVEKEKDLREGEYFDVLKLDDVLTGVKADDGVVSCLIIDEGAGLQVWQRCDSAFREIVVYTPPDRNAFCIEPYTCVTDAIHLQQQGIDAGWRTLAPGEQFATWIEIRAGRVIA